MQKRKKRWIWLLIILVLIYFLIHRNKKPQKMPSFNYKPTITDSAYKNHPMWVDGTFIVDFKDNTPMAKINKLERELGVDLEFTSKFSKDEKIMEGYAGDKLFQIIKKLKSNPCVECAEPDYYYHAYSLKPNDPLYKYQWNFEKIGMPKAWEYSTGKGIIVAVIDTGIAYTNYGRFHRVEDLEKTQFVKGYDFIHKNDKPLDDNGHGTHVAGTIAQSTNNHKGVAGIAFNAKIMPLKVLDANGYGKVSDIADAIRYAADHGAKVINLSLGGPFPSLVLKAACMYAWKKGAVIVCAAGNSRSKFPSYPAAYRECLAVSSIRYDDKLAPYSNRGSYIDIAAPGGDLSVDQNGDGKPDGVMQNTIQMRNPEKEGYYLFQGTSMAAPHVSGVAALIASTGVTNNREIVKILKKTARKKGIPLSEGYGSGILDASSALKYATIGRGWIQLAVAILVLLLFLFFIGSLKTSVSPLFILGWIWGSGGLFLLGYFTRNPKAISILSKGLPQWDALLLGASKAYNPIFYSVIIPFIIAIIMYKTPLQKLAAGISLGTASILTYTFLSNADIKIIPGIFLDKIWLLLNISLAIILTLILIKNPHTPQKN